MEIGLSLGSNLGDRAQHLSAARKHIRAVPGAQEKAASSLYETDPVDVQEAYRAMKFINAVLVIESKSDGPEWLDQVNRIEEKLGRVRSADKNAPRSIDIDILYAGDQCIDSGGLMVPHPRWAERAFVLQPLAEVRPHLVLPGYRRSVQELLQSLDPKDTCIKLEEEW